MFEGDGKYGTANINGNDIDIEKAEISDLKKYLEEKEEKRITLIEEQNGILSKIID